MIKHILFSIFVSVVLFTTNAAFGELTRVTPIVPKDLSDTEPVLFSPLRDNANTVLQKADPSTDLAPSKGTAKTRKANRGTVKPPDTVEEGRDRDEEIEGLKEQIEALKDQNALSQVIKNSTQTPTEAAKIQAMTVYAYIPGAIYTIDTAPDHFTDIFLQPGEEYRDVGAGDTARWIFSKSLSGDGASSQYHILVKPLQPGLSTNFAIYTNKHVYQIKARSVKNFYTPSISWTYPAEERDALIAMKNEQQRQEKLQANGKEPISPDKLNFKYKIKGDDYDWRPLRAMDDGAKTYIEMPPSMKSSEAPALFIVDSEGNLNIVNYRVSGTYFIVDRLFKEARLQLSEKEYIRIKKDN